MSKWQEGFLVAGFDDKVVGVESTLAAAVALGKSTFGKAPFVEACSSDMRRNDSDTGAALKAFKATGLVAQKFDEVMRMPLEEAWLKVRPMLDPSGRIKAYSTPAKMAKAMIGQNYKMEKQFEGISAVVKGLSLVPYYKGTEMLWAQEMGRSLPVVNAQKPSSPDVPTLCWGSNNQCRAGCLVSTGRNIGYAVLVKQYRVTALYKETQAFLRLLIEGIETFARPQNKKGNKALVRLNVYSDIPWELFIPGLFHYFDQPGRKVQFYDYTKVPGRTTPKNYDLTFSFSGTNWARCLDEAARGKRIAVVFAPTWKNGRLTDTELPESFEGMEVIDGDVTDVRPLDPGGVVVGLRFKSPKAEDGKLSKLGSFVVRVYQPEPGIFVTPHTARQSGAADFEA